MPARPSCPNAAAWTEFVLGRVSEADAAALGSHLDACPGCQRAVQTLHGEDTLTEAMRRPAPDAALPTQFLLELDRRLSQDGARPAAVDETVAFDTPAPPGGAGDELLTRLLSPQGPAEGPGRLGHFRVLRVLGAGGMGVVLEAVDERLRRPVALKVMKPNLAARPEARERFLREARAVAALDHDNVIRIYHVGEEAGVTPVPPGPLDATLAPAVIANVPTPSSPVPSAFRSAPRESGPAPVPILAPAATTRWPRAVTSSAAPLVDTPPSVRFPSPSR